MLSPGSLSLISDLIHVIHFILGGFMPFFRLLGLSVLGALLGATSTYSLPSGGGLTNSSNTGATVTGANLIPGPISFPSDFMVSIKSFGAVGDGVTDDTAAIQKALSYGRANPTANYMHSAKALFFPAGTYLVHDTLNWVGCCVTLQGAGSSTTVIRLAPGSAGFGDSTNPKPLILTPQGNESFHENIWDLKIEIGGSNAGATAVSYVSNNTGSIHNVLITSDDGRGHTGIDLTRAWAGPLMLRDVEIHGFDYGIDLNYAEYSSTLESITLMHQNQIGIRNVSQQLSIRRLYSVNSVAAVTNHGGFITLLDAELQGGSPYVSAVRTNSTMYVRNVTSSGYRATLEDGSTSKLLLIAGPITEHLVGKPQTLTASNNMVSLGLEVSETPSFTSTSLSDWGTFVPTRVNDASGLQPALNSGKGTLYFGQASYTFWNGAEATVPDSVNRIVGFSTGIEGAGIRLVITSNSSQPLIIEQFGYGLTIDHRGSRPVVIKDAQVTYLSSPGAGNLFLEDVQVMKPIVVQAGQQVWARQLDDEFKGTKILNNGGSLWILGLKTEQPGTVINTTEGGKTELLGALIYPACLVSASETAFQSSDSQVSYMYTELAYYTGWGHSIQVVEQVSGGTANIASPARFNYRMPLFIGQQ
jgi:hypothetical protein